MFLKECEDLRRENKFLANEIRMERIAMRTENELTMRNIRNVNQDLQAQVREVTAQFIVCVSLTAHYVEAASSCDNRDH